MDGSGPSLRHFRSVRSPVRTTRLGPGGEFDRIRSFQGLSLGESGTGGGVGSSGELPLGPGDDAAWVDGFVFSVDLAVEGIHFRRSWLSLEEVGFRAVAAAGSDLAAMASEPVGILLALALPRDLGEEELAQLRRGVGQGCEAVGGPLLGGDLSASPGPLVLDVTVVGRTSDPVLRSGAEPGDELWVTGGLGASAAAVRIQGQGHRPSPALHRAYARPRPRIQEALWLRERGVLRAMLDLSDGLAGDAGHLAAASGVAVVLEEDTLPVDPEVGAAGDVSEEEGRRLALHGGEDFELLFAAPPGSVGPDEVEGFRARFHLPLTRVGRVEAGAGVRLEPQDGSPARPLTEGGFDHFAPGGGGGG